MSATQTTSQVEDSTAEGLRAANRLEAVYRELVAPGGAFSMSSRSVDGRTVEVFDDTPTTLGALFQASVHDDERELLVYGEERWTHRRMRLEVAGLARHLRTRIAPGDIVAIAMRNYPEWVVAFWAIQVVGAVLVQLNAWSTRRELEVLVERARPVALIADNDRLDRLAGWLAAHPHVHVVGVRTAALPAGAVPFNSCTAGGSEADLRPAERDATDMATLLYTSGTTGRPKGVIGSHLNHITALQCMRLRTAAREQLAATVGAVQTTSLMTYPLFHVSGIAVLVSGLVTGKRVVLMYRWDAAKALRLIDELGVSEVLSPPMVTRELVAAARDQGCALPSLRTVGGGGAASSPGLIRDIEEVFGGRVAASTAYGLTETTGAVLSSAGPVLAAFPTSVGRPLPGVGLRIVTEGGTPAAPGAPGEVQIHGALVSAGYLDEPELTAQSFAGGWFHTGDLGLLDQHGFLHLVGRSKDIIIRGGENIYPHEIEHVLEEHPDVVEAAVFGKPDESTGERVAAVVRLVSGATATPAELRGFVGESIARHKVPSEIAIVNEPLPRTATGKIIKAGL